MRLSVLLVPVFVLVAASCAKQTPAPAPAVAEADTFSPPADAPLPFDPRVRSGAFDNGLRWYIMPNGLPDDRAELRIFVNAGSVQEDDDQRGIAHWVEHMAFNGTEHFEGNTLIEYLESIGARFGPDLNAYTNLNETVYMLQIPTDDPEVLAKSFVVLEDWAHGLLFDPDETDKERGVVMEEWRRSRGAWGRMRDATHPVVYQGSKYADRQTIGTEESLTGATVEAVERFYRDWYRPELMSVAAVGDFDPDVVQGLIEKHFGGLTNADGAREREDVTVPPQDEPRGVVFTDPELGSASIAMYQWQDWQWGKTHGAYLDDQIEGLAFSMLNERLADLAMRPDTAFQNARVGRWRRSRTQATRNISVSGLEEQLVSGFEQALSEVRRAQLHGFNEGELDRAKKRSMRSIERAWQERETTESSRYASEIGRHTLAGEYMPGIDYEWKLAQYSAEVVTLAQVNAFMAGWFTTRDNRVVTATLPTGPDVEPPTVEGLIALTDDVLARDLPPWEEKPVPSSLVANPPERGEVVEREEVASVGITRWKLDNGVEVLLKPTDFKEDQILIRGWSWGGTSTADDDAFFSAGVANRIRGRSGLGDLDERQLDKFLAGKRASMGPWIREYEEGFTGSASAEDLGIALEMLHLAFVAPRFDADAFDLELRDLEQRLSHQDRNPRAVFGAALAEVRWDNALRKRQWQPEDLEDIDLAEAAAFYRERFADAADFTFALVGSFDPDTVEPLVTQWLATLPAADGADDFVDRGLAEKAGPVKHTVRKGLEQKASVRMTMHGDAAFSRDDSYLLTAMTGILRVKLRERVREKMSGTYSISSWGGIDRYPSEQFEVAVNFECDPARVDELKAAVYEELEAMRAEAVDASYIDSYKAKELRRRETAVKENRSWASWLSSYHRSGWELEQILEFDALLDLVTPESIHDAAQRWLHPEAALEVVLLPEGQD